MTFWFNYIIFETKKFKKTYIGSTVNPTRRFRQHNSEITGGAKYTRGGLWSPYIILADLAHTKNTALSYEWHLKRFSKHFKSTKNFHLKRKKGLEKFIQTKISNKIKSYTHIIFVNHKYKNITPLVPSSVFIMYLNPNQFTTENLIKLVNQIKLINYLKQINLNDNIFPLKVNNHSHQI